MPRTPELLTISRAAAEIKWAPIPPAERHVRLVRPCFKRSWLVYLCVRGNTWCVAEFPYARLSAAMQHSDAVQAHFSPWLLKPWYHYHPTAAEGNARYAAAHLQRLEAYLNAEHKAGRAGLCERSFVGVYSLTITQPRPKPAKEVFREAVNTEITLVSERVNTLAAEFAGFKQSNAIRATKLADRLDLLIAQQSEIQATQRAVKTYLAQVSAHQADLGTERLLAALAQAPCNGRGHVDRRAVAASLGATPEQLDRIFPTPSPSPAPPPVWLPGVTAALRTAENHPDRVIRGEARSALNDLAEAYPAAFPESLPQRD